MNEWAKSLTPRKAYVFQLVPSSKSSPCLFLGVVTSAWGKTTNIDMQMGNITLTLTVPVRGARLDH